MMQNFRLIAYFVLLLAGHAHLYAQWNYSNPLPTPEPFSAVAFTDSVNGFAVTARGGFYKTSSAGQRWNFVKSIPFSGIYLTDMVFSSPDQGIFSAVGGVVIRTTDQGQTWDSIFTGTEYDLLSVFMWNADTGYITGAHGVLLKTTDGGASWLLFSPGMTNDFFDCWFTSAATGFIAANQMILKTVDGGNTWSKVFSPPQGYNCTRVRFASQSVGLAIGRKGGIFRTTDQGVTWTQVPSGTDRNLNALGFFPPQVALVSSGAGEILRSPDLGQTWQQIKTDFTFNFDGISTAGSRHALAWGPFGAIWYSADIGVTWEASSYVTLEQLWAVACFSDEHVIAGGTGGNVVKTNDGGDHWKVVPTGSPHTINTMATTGQSTGYLAGDQGLLMKTTDGGESWQTLTSPELYSWRCLAFSDENTGLLSGSGANIYRTSNGGQSWLAIPTGTSEAVNGVALRGNRAFACGSNALLMRSADGGLTWTRIILPELLQANLTRISSPDEDHCYITGNQYIMNSWVIFFAGTTDGGDHWKVRTYTYYPDKVVMSLWFNDPLNGYLGGSDFLWRTVDGGDHWIEQKPANAPAGPNAIGFSSLQTGFAVGYYGQILKTVNGGGWGGDFHEETVPESVLVVPNPASDRVRIIFNAETDGFTHISLFGQAGSLVAEWKRKRIQKGRNVITLETGKLPAGMYVGKISSESTLLVFKLVVVPSGTR